MRNLKLSGDRDNRSKAYALKAKGYKAGYILNRPLPCNTIITSPLAKADATPVLLEASEEVPANFVEMTQTHFLKFFGGSIGGRWNRITKEFELSL